MTDSPDSLPLPEPPYIDYDDIEAAITNAPQTFLPALLAKAVEACIDKKVFRDLPAIERFVTTVILKKVNPKGER